MGERIQVKYITTQLTRRNQMQVRREQEGRNLHGVLITSILAAVIEMGVFMCFLKK